VAKTEAELLDYIKTNFGYFSYFLNIPEVGQALRDAANAGEDANRLYQRIANTNWWKQTSAAARTWDALVAEDPATAQAKRNQMTVLIRNMAGEGGISYDQVAGLVEPALRLGLDEASIRSAIASSITWTNSGASSRGGDLPGSIGEAVQRIQQTAQDYFVLIGDRTAFEWGRKIFSGEMTLEGAASEIRRQAISKFPNLAEQIGQGFTLNDLFDPYRQEIARTLEMAPEAVDFVGDPRWQRVLSVADSNNGKVRPMTLSEAVQYARKQDEFRTTRTANQEGASLARAITENMGKAAF
jgi:hypothetical protein